MKCYGKYLQDQLENAKHNQSLSHPVREVATSCFVKYRASSNIVANIYHPLDDAVKQTQLLEPILFDESKHLTEPFPTSLQRFHFISKLNLSTPVETLHYCPGGSTYGVQYVWRVDPNRTVDDDKLQTSRVVATLQPLLPSSQSESFTLPFQVQ